PSGNLGAGTQRHHENNTVHAKYLLRTKKENQPTFEKNISIARSQLSPCRDLQTWGAFRSWNLSERTRLKNRKKESSILVRVKEKSGTHALGAPYLALLRAHYCGENNCLKKIVKMEKPSV